MVGNEFGRIVEEIYHPNGNDGYNDAKDNYNDAQNNYDDAKDNFDNSADNNNHPTQPISPS